MTAAESDLDAAIASARTSAATVVGPWISEVGFEVLYWIPFLRWLAERHELDPRRLTAVSRGGVASWYRPTCAGYREIFEAAGTDEFRERSAERWSETGLQKHLSFAGWDRELLEQTVGADWERAALLHPSLMYRLCHDAWRGREPLGPVVDRLVHARWEQPRDEELEARLPERFLAVKFYFRPSFPDTDENRRFVTSLLRALRRETPIVLLAAELRVDDHHDFDPGDGEDVIRVLDGVPPERNLHVQAVAISRAAAFVGTYGGLSYLASVYGVPAVAFASEPRRHVPIHLEVARVAAAACGTTLTAVDPATLPLAKLAAAVAEAV